MPVFAVVNAQKHVGTEARRILNYDCPYWQVSATGSYTPQRVIAWRLHADSIRLQASWDIPSTNRDYHGPKGSLLSVGVAWQL